MYGTVVSYDGDWCRLTRLSGGILVPASSACLACGCMAGHTYIQYVQTDQADRKGKWATLTDGRKVLVSYRRDGNFRGRKGKCGSRWLDSREQGEKRETIYNPPPLFWFGRSLSLFSGDKWSFLHGEGRKRGRRKELPRPLLSSPFIFSLPLDRS